MLSGERYIRSLLPTHRLMAFPWTAVRSPGAWYPFFPVILGGWPAGLLPVEGRRTLGKVPWDA